MVLSDRSIREEVAAGRIGLDPFDPALVQPSSIDVRCDRRFRVFHPGRYPFIDVRVPMPDLTELVEIDDDRAFILHPGEFVLGATAEVLRLPDDLVARLDGKSSLGRLGLQVHSTAGLADPGFEGQITLELSNIASLPIAIYPGMRMRSSCSSGSPPRPTGRTAPAASASSTRDSGADRERVLAQLLEVTPPFVTRMPGEYPTRRVHSGYRGKEVVGILSSGLCSESPASGGARR